MWKERCLYCIVLYLFVFRSDSVRPFISGHVADSMAAEVIALLHGLLTAPVSLTAQSWAAAVEKVSILIKNVHL